MDAPWKISFFVPGLAKPAGSKRAFAQSRTKKIVVIDACKKSADWKVEVRATAYAEMIGKGGLRTGPLAMSITFTMPRPKSHYGTGKNSGFLKSGVQLWHTFKPDATKLTRCLEDALTGVVWADDAQIAKQEVFKVYGDRLGADVIISELDPQEF